MQVHGKSNTDSLKIEVDFSKDIIDGIFSGKTVDESIRSVSVTEKDKKEILEHSHEASKITGLKELTINEDDAYRDNVKNMVLEAKTLIFRRPFPSKAKKQILFIEHKIAKYEEFLVKFLKKYR